jgi:hypothetical protein
VGKPKTDIRKEGSQFLNLCKYKLLLLIVMKRNFFVPIIGLPFDTIILLFIGNTTSRLKQKGWDAIKTTQP